jgi:hypothetical protein
VTLDEEGGQGALRVASCGMEVIWLHGTYNYISKYSFNDINILRSSFSCLENQLLCDAITQLLPYSAIVRAWDAIGLITALHFADVVAGL